MIMKSGKLGNYKGLLASNPPYPPPTDAGDLRKGAVASKPPIEPPKTPPPANSGGKK
jgi:hypothetical protein